VVRGAARGGYAELDRNRAASLRQPAAGGAALERHDDGVAAGLDHPPGAVPPAATDDQARAV
jgi:hypothetical protein